MILLHVVLHYSILHCSSPFNNQIDTYYSTHDQWLNSLYSLLYSTIRSTFSTLLNYQIHTVLFFLLNNQIHTVYSTQRPNLHFLFYSTTKSTQLCLLNDQIRTVYFTQRLNSHCSHFSSTYILVAIRFLSLYLSFPPTVISLIPYYFTIIAHGPSACPSRLKIINLTCTRF